MPHCRKRTALRPHPIILCLLLLLLPACTAYAQVSGESVRIRLHEPHAPTAITLSGVQGELRLFAADFQQPMTVLPAGEEVLIRVNQDQVYIKAGTSGIFARSLRVETEADARISLSIQEGQSTTGPLRYQGRFFIETNQQASVLQVVNEVDLEDYVAAVISREYGFDDLEGNKAMAVIIRTYTLSTLGKFGPAYDHVDHTLSQIYQGTDAVTPTILEAVRQTRGEVLTYQGRLIEAVYFSSSGGHTADNETVWQSAARPYLRGKRDPYSARSPHAQWQASISRPRLLQILSTTYGFEVEGFHIGRRGPDERVETIDLLKVNGDTHTIAANDFRILIIRHFGSDTVRSTLFKARRAGDQYIFTGRGNGHGVGLSQWGAHEMARQGKTYREILDFYYTGVTLQRRGEPARPAPPAPLVIKEEPQEERRPGGRIGW